MDSLLLSFGSIQLEWHNALLSFLLSFLLASVIAYTYERTFRGLSYSTGFVQSMVLGSMVSCLLMIAIGDNVARGIGIVGSLAVIRFRTNLRDPRDLVFVFASLGVGVAAGVQSYITAITGAALFCLAALLLASTAFGSRRQNDGLVRFQISSNADSSEKIAEIMRRIPKQFALVTMRDVAQGEMTDYAYQVKLSHPQDGEKLLDELGKLEGIRGLTYINQAATVEV